MSNPRITIGNRQRRLAVDRRKLIALSRYLLARALDRCGLPAPSEICIIVTGHDQMRTCKQACFGVDQTTDVIALRYAPGPAETRWSAEIIVNVEQAEDWSRRSKAGNLSRELALYIAHGMDHLTGGEDHTRSERQKMRRTELGWLRDADAAGLIAGIAG
jgi:rRNA maturation RNase YbeY